MFDYYNFSNRIYVLKQLTIQGEAKLSVCGGGGANVGLPLDYYIKYNVSVNTGILLLPYLIIIDAPLPPVVCFFLMHLN